MAVAGREDDMRQEMTCHVSDEELASSSSSLPDLHDQSSHDNLYTCLLCVDGFHNAKLLECSHAFCEHCLVAYYRAFGGTHYEQMGVFLTCPTCRRLTKLPPNGYDGLNITYNNEVLAQLDRRFSTVNIGIQRCDVCIYHNRLLECEYYCGACSLNMCAACNTSHATQQLFKDHSVIHISNKEILNLYCDQHNKRQIRYFCMDCNSSVCCVCVLHDHAKHNTMKLKAALQLRRDNIKTHLNSLGPLIDKTEGKLKRLSYLKTLKSKGYHTLHRSTSECNTAAMDSSAAVDKRKMSAVENTSGDVETDRAIQMMFFHLDRIRKLYDLAVKTLEMSQSKKLLAIYKELLCRLQSVSEVEVKHIQEKIEGMLQHSETMVTEMMHSMNSASSTLHTDQSSSTEDTSSIDEKFETPKASMLVRPKLIWRVEKHRSDTAELWNPCDVSFTSDGNIVVAEYDIMNDRNNRLRIFDQVGKTAGVIAQGQIRPLGLTTTIHGNIAVTDCKNKRVKVYTPSGQLMSEWGKGQFGWPYGIAVNSKGLYIVTDAFNDTISIHTPDGKRLKQFGSSGAGSNQFRNPYHVAVDHRDNIIVSDCGNNCFKVFSSDGQYMFRSSNTRSGTDTFFFERKKKKCKMRAPRGINVDMKGNILIADDNQRVCLFDSYGKYVRNILTDEDSVRFAEGLATNSQGLLAVTEWNPNNMFAVGVFSLYE